MNLRMVDNALDTLREVDVVVLVVDATARPGSGDAFVVDVVKRAHRPAILALNKVDRIHKPHLLPIIEHFAKMLDFKAIVPVSALHGDGVAGLEAEIVAALPEGPALYPDDYLTDQSERTLAAELIREKVLANTHDELPYTTAVLIDQYEDAAEEGGLTRIHASILVETESQKPIVIGKGGEMIKRIGTDARRDLEQMLDGKVFLDLHVKVRQDWRDDERVLDALGMRPRR